MKCDLSIIIVTRNRPDMIGRCLEHIYEQDCGEFEAVVIDTSIDNRTKEIVCNKYPQVKYIFLPNGKNKRHLSKNMGIKNVRGNIVAFIDDDTIIQKGWMEACLNSYGRTNTGGVGGMIIDTNAPKEIYGTDEIGKIAFNGTRLGNFDKDPGAIVEVDHLRGCNMSFRREVLEQINGFDLNYTGSNVLEETDLSTRVKKAGYKIFFNPAMKVIHTAGKREVVFREAFTLKREFYIARNSTYFMLVNFGIWRTFMYMVSNDTGIVAFLRKPRFNAFCCVFIFVIGKCVGLCVGLKEILFRRYKR